jgi:hypothetical protein
MVCFEEKGVDLVESEKKIECGELELWCKVARAGGRACGSG